MKINVTFSLLLPIVCILEILIIIINVNYNKIGMFTITEGIVQDEDVGLKYPMQNTMDVHTRRFPDAIMYKDQGKCCVN